MSELYDEWNNKRIFKIERDKFKKKRYLYTSPFQIVCNGFNNKNLFPYVYSDVLNKAYRMMGYNVMYPVICNNLNDTSYSYSRLRGEGIEGLRKNHIEELKDLNIGFDIEKEISLNDLTTIKFIQDTFKEMYNKGYINLKKMDVFTDFSSHNVYSKSMVKIVNDKYYLKDSDEDMFAHKMDVFTIDVSKFPSLIDKIASLNIEQAYKDKIYDYLGCKKGLKIGLKNENFEVFVMLDNPQYLAGISFVCLNPKYIDVLMYTTPDEYMSVSEFLVDEDIDNDCFTGVILKNPLTFKDIYVFASYKYEEGVHAGIPSMDTLDHMFASNIGLDENIFLDEDMNLINSDFLDGLNIDLARETICKAFTDEGMATLYLKPEEDLIISSFQDLGILIPLGADYKGEMVVLDEKYYPIYFSNRFKPTATNEESLDSNISIQKMTFNKGFVLGLISIYAKIYDNMMGSFEFYNENSPYNDFKDIVGVFDESNVVEEVLFNTIFNMYFESIGKQYSSFSKFVILNDSKVNIDYLGEQQRLGVSFVNEILTRYSSDTYRLYLLSNNNLSDDLKETIELLDTYKAMISEIKKAFEEPFRNQAFDNIYFSEFVRSCNKLLESFEIVKLTKTIMTFFKSFVLPHNISKDEAHRFIIILSIILPKISEDINKEVFNDRYSIFYSEFPKA